VGSTSRPADLDERLLASGLSRVGDSPGMALDLADWEIDAPLPDGVTIELVIDEAGLRRWRDVQQRGLGLDDEAAEAWWRAHRRPGFDPGSPLRNWIASLDGTPVAAAALFVGAGVAGVYNVCTVPEARGRGIGRAVTTAALDAASVDGLPIAVLGSSEMGYPVYRRLGFRDVSRLRSYTREA
jgi:ribosomal protein S18 acetylase RimI-like enzyme